MSMKIVYAVPYIEVEFGQRDEGYKLYLDKARCTFETKEMSRNGPHAGGYFGPARSLCYVEVPFDSLEQEYKDKLNNENGVCWTENNWKPKFKSKEIDIV